MPKPYNNMGRRDTKDKNLARSCSREDHRSHLLKLPLLIVLQNTPEVEAVLPEPKLHFLVPS